MKSALRLRHVAQINPSTPKFDELPHDADVTFLPLETVWPGALDTTRVRRKADVSAGYTRFQTGDILVPKITPTFEADRSTMAHSLQGDVGAGTTELHIVRPGKDVSGRYLNYLLSTHPFLLGGEAEMIGVAGQKRVPDSWLRNFPVPVTDLVKQHAIVNFLDAETARIDALIAKKRRLAQLVLERSRSDQIDISCGRTLGHRLQPSGHDWLGHIPSHWPVERLKYVARLESGHTPSRSNEALWVDCKVPWITLNDVGYLQAHEYVEETRNLISEQGLAASSARVLPAGTVALSRDATVGRCGILAVSMATSQHFVNWICSQRLHPRFLWLLFRWAMQSHFEALTDGATLKTIGMPDVKMIVVPVPSIDEQERIVAEASAVRSQATRTVHSLDHQIKLLQEHRQALITAVVTGEMEVPGVRSDGR
jgi:type I restriction enzyme, S subunit